MLKRDKNRFLEVIKESGLKHSLFKRFEKGDVEGSPAFIIQLKNSPMFFMARTDSSDYFSHDSRYIEFSPKFTKSDYRPHNGWDNIEGVLEIFNNWLEMHVKTYLEELEETDLWEQLEGRVLFGSDPMSNRTSGQFSKPEKERIQESLVNFKALIELEYAPTNEQLEVIQDRIDYLSDSVNRLNKTDWQGIAVSAIISISIALNLDTEKGKNLFSLFKQSFAAMLEYMK